MGSATEILLATDFCDPAQCALACARQIARLRGAAVRALHVMDFTGAAADERPPYSAVRDSAEHRLREIRRELRLAGVPESATLVAAGRPARAIRATAVQYQAALLILGLNGSRSRKSSTLGATARALLRHSPCPVLTVAAPCPDLSPEPASARALHHPILERPVFVADTAPESLRAALAAWPSPAESSTTRVVLPPDGRRRIVQGAATPKIPAGSLEFAGAARTLLRKAEATRAGIIVLGLRGGGYLDSFATGSFAHAIATGAGCPVLTVRC